VSDMGREDEVTGSEWLVASVYSLEGEDFTEMGSQSGFRVRRNLLHFSWQASSVESPETRVELALTL